MLGSPLKVIHVSLQCLLLRTDLLLLPVHPLRRDVSGVHPCSKLPQLLGIIYPRLSQVVNVICNSLAFL